jgi:hypothetical protein
VRTNRLSPYEAGWLTMLVEQGICTRGDAQAAMHRVAQAAIDELNARREAEKYVRKKKRKKREDE